MKRILTYLLCLSFLLCMVPTAEGSFPVAQQVYGEENVTQSGKDAQVLQSLLAFETYDNLPARDMPLPEDLTPWDGTVATAFDGGKGTPEDPYQIANAAQFAFFMKMCNDFSFTDTNNNGGARYTALNYVLTADICLNPDFTIDSDGNVVGASSLKVTPVMDPDQIFTGTFKGNGHCIFNPYITSGDGLFSTLDASALLENVHLVRGYFKSNSYLAGVLVREISSFTIVKGCSVSTYAKYSNNTDSSVFGGIIGGVNSGNSTVYGCEFRGEIHATSVDAKAVVGGVIGMYYDCTAHLALKNCINRGSISGSAYVMGGIVGKPYNNYKNFGMGINLSGCVNFGDVSNTAGLAGGIIGEMQGVNYTVTTLAMTYCANFGDIFAGTNYAGGLMSRFTMRENTDAGKVLKITACYNMGDVSTTGYCVGGMIGLVRGCVSFESCGVSGTVSGSLQVGGMVGLVDHNFTQYRGNGSMMDVKGCWTNCDVKATGEGAGGVLGALLVGSSKQEENYLYVGGSVLSGTVTAPTHAGGLLGYVNEGQTKKRAAQLNVEYTLSSILVTYREGGVAGCIHGGRKSTSIIVALSAAGKRNYIYNVMHEANPAWEVTSVVEGATMTGGSKLSLDTTYDPENLTNGTYLNILNIYATQKSLPHWKQGKEKPLHTVNATLESLGLEREYDGQATKLPTANFNGAEPVLKWEKWDEDTQSWENMKQAPLEVGKYRLQVAYLTARSQGADSIVFEILPRYFDMSQVSWKSQTTFTYTGTEQTMTLDGLPSSFVVQYAGNSYINAGNYTASLVSVTDPTGNYRIINVDKVKPQAWKIDTLSLNVNNIHWSHIDPATGLPTLTYNEGDQVVYLVYEGNPDLDLSLIFNIDYTYTKNGSQVAAGRDVSDRYQAKAVVTQEDYSNVTVTGVWTTTYTTAWRIVKRNINPADYIIFDNLTVTYDGNSYMLDYYGEELPGCVKQVKEGRGKGTNAGTYAVTYTYTLTDTANNTLTDGTTANLSQVVITRQLVIEPAVPKITAGGFDMTYDGEMHTIDEERASFSIKGSDEIKEELEKSGSLSFEYYYAGHMTGTPMEGVQNAAEYTVKVIFHSQNPNFKDGTYITVPVYVNRATLVLEGDIVFRNGTFVSDGSPKMLELKNADKLPEFVYVTYSEPQTDAGKYTVACYFHFTPEMEGNYQPLPTLTATMTILTYELIDQETGLRVAFPTGQPNPYRLLVKKHNEDVFGKINTSHQVAWNTSLKALYQVEMKQNLTSITETDVAFTVKIPITRAMVEKANKGELYVVSIIFDEHGGYTITKHLFEAENMSGETYLTFQATQVAYYGIVTTDSPTGYYVWVGTSVLILAPAILVFSIGVHAHRVRKRNRKNEI